MCFIFRGSMGRVSLSPLMFRPAKSSLALGVRAMQKPESKRRECSFFRFIERPSNDRTRPGARSRLDFAEEAVKVAV